MKPEIVQVKPPMALMLDTRIPGLTGDTYGDVIDYAVKLKGAIQTCNSKLESLREWSDGD